MQCPVCDHVTLREVVKNGVMIDVCPTCKGVWLDRGELDKLMQDVHEAHKEYDYMQSHAAPPAHKPQRPYPQQDYDRMPHHSYDHAPSPSYYEEKQPPFYKKPYSKDGHYGSQHKDYHVGYDKYGRPYKKKKKTVFNMLEDLFD